MTVAAIGILIRRRDLWRNALLVLGLILSLGMTLAKAVNYHQLEAVYRASFGPLAIADVVELVGIASPAKAEWMRGTDPACGWPVVASRSASTWAGILPKGLAGAQKGFPAQPLSA